jgi:NAD(P)-dependent dehydrogenase (short-subunit alcohol dehydrogenase family)
MAAIEWAPRVRVNAVAPGFVDFDGRGGHAVRDAAPLKALPSPAEVAQAVLFLLESDSITGQVLYVDGGRHLKGRVFDI